MVAPKLAVVEGESDFWVDDYESPFVGPGNYEFMYVKHETDLYFGRAPKLVMWFKIVSMGECFETVLPRYYNVKQLIGPKGKNGKFKVGRQSDFLREFVTLFPDAVDSNPRKRRLDRLPMSGFKSVILQGHVSTVNRTAKQRAIPEALQYSVISELIRVVK